MIRLLAYVFLCCAAYGVWVGMWGGVVLSLFMWVFMHYAQGWFAAQDRAYATDPARASAQTPTSCALQQHDTECMADKI